MSGHHSRSAGRPGTPPVALEIEHLPRPTKLPPLQPSLPVGVALLAVAMGVLAFIVLLAGALILLNSLLGSTVVPTGLLITQSVDAWGAAILIILGAASLALARALWDLEQWSLYVTVGLAFTGMTYLFFTGSVTVLFLVLLGVFMYLLWVRHHFY
ncbi:MAG TPA: hypothetical protein VGV89_02305 [Thermoplasmata archaeon]|nr:hypothetical protein [Thermoplasmata archaeon]